MYLKNLKKIRQKNKLTQPQMADILKISTSTYQYYEYGKRIPSLKVLCKIADFFNVSIDYLLDRNIDNVEELDLLDSLQIEFNMTSIEKTLLNDYLSLNKNTRINMMSFLQNAFNVIQSEHNDKHSNTVSNNILTTYKFSNHIDKSETENV